MNVLIQCAIALLVFCSAVAIDFAAARYVRAVAALDAHRAARWSAMQWLSGVVGFIIAVKYSIWMLPAEMAGLYVGTVLSIRGTIRGMRVTPLRVVPDEVASRR